MVSNDITKLYNKSCNELCTSLIENYKKKQQQKNNCLWCDAALRTPRLAPGEDAHPVPTLCPSAPLHSGSDTPPGPPPLRGCGASVSAQSFVVAARPRKTIVLPLRRCVLLQGGHCEQPAQPLTVVHGRVCAAPRQVWTLRVLQFHVPLHGDKLSNAMQHQRTPLLLDHLNVATCP